MRRRVVDILSFHGLLAGCALLLLAGMVPALLWLEDAPADIQVLGSIAVAFGVPVLTIRALGRLLHHLTRR